MSNITNSPTSTTIACPINVGENKSNLSNGNKFKAP